MPEMNEFLFKHTLPACGAAFFTFYILAFLTRRKWTGEAGGGTRFANLHFYAFVGLVSGLTYLLFQHFGPPYEPFRKQSWILLLAFPAGIFTGVMTVSLSKRDALSFMKLLWLWLILWITRFCLCVLLVQLMKREGTSTLTLILTSVIMLLGWWGALRLSTRVNHAWLSILAFLWFFAIGNDIAFSNELKTGKIAMSISMIIASVFVARTIVQFMMRKRQVQGVNLENLRASILDQGYNDTINIDMIYPVAAGLLIATNTNFFGDVTNFSSIGLALSPMIAAIAYVFWPAGKMATTDPSGMLVIKKHKTAAAIIIFFIALAASSYHTIAENNKPEPGDSGDSGSYYDYGKLK